MLIPQHSHPTPHQFLRSSHQNYMDHPQNDQQVGFVCFGHQIDPWSIGFWSMVLIMAYTVSAQCSSAIEVAYFYMTNVWLHRYSHHSDQTWIDQEQHSGSPNPPYCCNQAHYALLWHQFSSF